MRNVGNRLGVLMLVPAMLITAPGWVSSTAHATQPDNQAIFEMSMEDLLDMQVTSVSKRSQSLQDAPAAVFVLTGDDLEQMGVTTIPDALRRVPGLEVSQIDGNKWAVTARGFNGRFSNKLLVLVDGRSVYTTSFSGVYWDVQDPMIGDIDRIEIIRGPGSTLWGANAVNGVINIITKHAADTQGGLVVAGAGDIEEGFTSVRYGTKLSPETFARFYGKGFQRGQSRFPNGKNAGDDWNMLRGGFRLDSQSTTTRTLTLQGDIYRGRINQQTDLATWTPPYALHLDHDEAKTSGGNLLGRMTRTLSPTSELSLQVYYDRAMRDEAIARQKTTQIDYDFQHHFAHGQHNIVWGLGYRYIKDDTQQRLLDAHTLGVREFNLFSAFLQDEISLSQNRLALIMGSKVEHNDFTGLEVQPSIRLLWKVRPQHRIWAAVSRAVRTPNRSEDKFEILADVIPPDTALNPGPLPVGLIVTGNQNIQAEELAAYELGYRFHQSGFSTDITVFYNDYTNLQENLIQPPEVHTDVYPPFITQALTFSNNGQLSTYGGELAVSWQTRTWLRWDLAYSLLKYDIGDTDFLEGMDQSPKNQTSLAVVLKPSTVLTFSGYVRYVDSCRTRGIDSPTGRTIPSYTSGDLVMGLRLSSNATLTLVGRNLLEKDHLEYLAEAFTAPTYVPRSFFAKIQWRF